jgi:hypothetical protein
MVSLRVDIKKKDLWLISAIFVFIVGVGFVMSAWDPAKTMFHSAADVKILSLDKSLEEAVSDGDFTSGSEPELRVWQNMGPRGSADSQDHTTSCNAGYLMSGLRIWSSGALDGRMIAHCTESSLSLSGSTTKTGPSISADNQFHNVNCDADQVIKEIKIRASSYLDGNIRLDCKNLVGASLDNANSVWAYHRYHGASNDQYGSDLNTNDNSDQAASCPLGYVATGVRFWATGSLESFDILCKKII